MDLYTRTLCGIDTVFCKGIYNPTVWGLVAIASAVAVHTSQLFHLSRYGDAEFIFVSDYLIDMVQVSVSLLFYLRFSMGKFFGPVGETVLLVLQNLGCGLLLFHRQFSLVYSPINPVIKVFVMGQIACPYAIIVFSAMRELRRNRSPKVDDEENSMGTDPENDDSETSGYLGFVIDTNNNFLPIFMGHSFLCLNSRFPFSVWPAVVAVNKAAQLALKFYCVHVFCLFEMVLIRHDVIGQGLAAKYAEYYSPVVLGEPKMHPQDSEMETESNIRGVSRKDFCALAAFATVGFFDVLFMGISAMPSFYD